MKFSTSLIILFFLSKSIIGQTYIEIPIDTSEHFNINLVPGETKYYRTLSGSAGQYNSASIVLIDSTDEAIDFLDIQIEDIFLAAIAGSTIVWSIDFKVSLKDDVPLPSDVENASLVSIFLNSSNNVIGGFIRSNISITIDGTTATPKMPLKGANVKVYPNPASEFIFFKSLDGRKLGKITIMNTVGHTLLQEKVSGSEHLLNLRDIPSGHYWVRVQNQYSYQLSAIFVK